MTLLHYLAWSSKTSSDDFGRYYQQSHLDLRNVNTEGQSVLHFAAQRGNLDIIRYIARTDGTLKTLVDLKDTKGRTALHSAVESRRGPEIVAILLSHGADIRVRDHYGRSVLHHAARMGRIPAIKSLVKALNPNMVCELYLTDTWGNTPAMVAVLYKSHHIAVFLMAEMAKVMKHSKAPLDTRWVRNDTERFMIPTPGRSSGDSLVQSIAPSTSSQKEVPLQLGTVMSRLDKDGDLFKEGWHQRLPKRMIRNLGPLEARWALAFWILVCVLLLWRHVYCSNLVR